jgi:galactokinase
VEGAVNTAAPGIGADRLGAGCRVTGARAGGVIVGQELHHQVGEVAPRLKLPELLEERIGLEEDLFKSVRCPPKRI